MTWSLRAAGAAAVLVLATACTSDPASDPASDPTPTADAASGPTPGRLSLPRAVHRATALPDGTVLLTGGCSAEGCGGFDDARAAEIVGPDGIAMTGPTAAEPRANGTATLLRDGRVLLTGGYPGEGGQPTASMEVFDPGTRSFRSIGELAEARADHSATLLPDGLVLIAGGFDAAGDALATTELFDPDTDRTSPGPALSEARAAQVAVALDETVLLVGGTRTGPALRSTDVLTESAWSPGPDLGTPRVKAGLVPIGPDRALVVGGSRATEGREKLATTEVVPLGGPAVAGPELNAGTYKLDGAVALLPDGRVVIPAGALLEVYDPVSSTLVAVPDVRLPERSFRTVTAVGPTTVLVAGGYDDRITPQPDLDLVEVPAAG